MIWTRCHNPLSMYYCWYFFPGNEEAKEILDQRPFCVFYWGILRKCFLMGWKKIDSNLPSKDTCLTTKKTPYVLSSIRILGLRVLSDCQYRDDLESKAKLASKKLGVIGLARQYFTPKHRLALYRAQVWPHMEYCSHLSAGAPQYQIEPLERIHPRDVRFVGEPIICERLYVT